MTSEGWRWVVRLSAVLGGRRYGGGAMMLMVIGEEARGPGRAGRGR